MNENQKNDEEMTFQQASTIAHSPGLEETTSLEKAREKLRNELFETTNETARKIYITLIHYINTELAIREAIVSFGLRNS